MIQHGKPGEKIEGRDYSDLLARAGKCVLALFNERSDARLVFHYYSFTVDLVECTEELAEEEDAEPAQKAQALVAAWFFHSGRLFDYEKHAEHSLRLARDFLARHAPDEAFREKALLCLALGLSEEETTSSPALWLRDANTISTFLQDPDERRPLLHLEWELMLRRRLSRPEWTQYWLQQLLGQRLFTHSARMRFEDKMAEQIRKLKKAVEKEGSSFSVHKKDEKTRSRLYHTLEKKQPTRAVQTFFRANYRNHINLSAIADNKANIMISVNSILISVLITILTYQNLSDNNPVILLPVVIFLVTGLASLIFAVLSARPKVTNLHLERDKEKIRRNMVFFGNFVHLDLDEYEEAMDAIFRDSELLYGNMTRDLYFLGKVLDKKYRYLSLSYNVFMLGFIATVGTFLIALLT